jgi:hypothetical protein
MRSWRGGGLLSLSLSTGECVETYILVCGYIPGYGTVQPTHPPYRHLPSPPSNSDTPPLFLLDGALLPVNFGSSG